MCGQNVVPLALYGLTLTSITNCISDFMSILPWWLNVSLSWTPIKRVLIVGNERSKKRGDGKLAMPLSVSFVFFLASPAQFLRALLCDNELSFLDLFFHHPGKQHCGWLVTAYCNFTSKIRAVSFRLLQFSLILTNAKYTFCSFAKGL